MKPNTTPGTSPEAKTNITSATKDRESQSASKKSFNIFLVFLTIASLTVAVTFAVLFFMNQPKNASNNQAGSSEQNPSGTGPDVEEKLTDAHIIRDLNKKISLLLNVATETGQSSSTDMGSIMYYDVDLFKNGNLSQSAKAGIIVWSIGSTVQSYIKYRPVDAPENCPTESNCNRYMTGFDGEKVREEYLGVFGENLPVGAEAQMYCGYKYDYEYDLYYSDALGCGGVTTFFRYYYNSGYTIDEDHAYVYISTALVDKESDAIYCDVASLDHDTYSISSDAEICGTLSGDYSDFLLDASNYESYSKYRFVFQKADDGIYFFEKVEQL